jgi:hypothetical protein
MASRSVDIGLRWLYGAGANNGDMLELFDEVRHAGRPND